MIHMHNVCTYKNSLPLLRSMIRKSTIAEPGDKSSLTWTMITPPTASKNVGAICPSSTGIVILINLLLAESLIVTYVCTHVYVQ